MDISGLIHMDGSGLIHLEVSGLEVTMVTERLTVRYIASKEHAFEAHPVL